MTTQEKTDKNLVCELYINKDVLYNKDNNIDKTNLILVLKEIIYKNYKEFIDAFKVSYKELNKEKDFILFNALYETLNSYINDININTIPISINNFPYTEYKTIIDTSKPFYINYSDFKITNLIDALNFNNILKDVRNINKSLFIKFEDLNNNDSEIDKIINLLDNNDNIL